jgi:HTH-type transcriptional regulator/antitoxin HigA
MDIRPIRTDEDHGNALREIERLWGAELGTPEGDRLDVLATLVEAYENTRWPIEALDPVDLIKAHMEASGLTQADLADVLRSLPRASEILNRKRPLSMEMVHRLSQEWHLPADLLVQPYPLASGSRLFSRRTAETRSHS